ncbi:ATP-binding protein [Aliiroseovarius sp. KMU-50]|uniref:ATP-binding protein n=1 Tax=Aliiroseovarius salicola TaxID=3009082 RepID=A0ABT4VYR9_9RHOB|nr:ATP-binding protein [Aliiroseovarius sp. KMU-50]MDA5092875.1 ATP-binding protein [Aliiroseovarius sp. KMU-50]
MHLESLPFMGHARDISNQTPPAACCGINLVFPGDSLAVRKALLTVQDGLKGMGVGDDTRSIAEIVLAEVLNNIVEHAYAGQDNGVVELHIHKHDKKLKMAIVDDGLPMPDNRLPNWTAHELDVRRDDLPEGGFGWSLIRDLSSDLTYARRNSQNRLSFSIQMNAQ